MCERLLDECNTCLDDSCVLVLRRSGVDRHAMRGATRYKDAVTDVHFSVEDDPRGPVVTAVGELDIAVKDALREVLAPLSGEVTVDLSKVTFVDSSAIGVFVGAHKRLTRNGGELRLRNPQDLPRRALEIVGLREWIED